MKSIHTTAALILMAAALPGQTAQPNPEPPKFYNLEFQVKEVEGGKVVNARSYYLMVSTDSNPAVVRTGGKVPYSTSPGSFNYVEVGVNIDCRGARERNGTLALQVSVDVSSIAPPAEAQPAGSGPLIRQNRWGSNVVVPLRKATVIFSSDDAASKRKMELELTATPIAAQ
jgi:hypothetical protein